MKKIYKRPELKVVECRTTHLMQQSNPALNLNNSTKASKDNATILSRKIDWDEWDTWDD